MRNTLGLGLCALLVACGTDGGSEPMPDAPGSTMNTWQPLISKTWSLPAGGEDTSDLQIEATTRDRVISGIRPLAPIGTHHTVLFRGVSGTNIVYASGVGTNELMFPAGKGMVIPAGTTLGLQLHIYNTSDEVLTGKSGIEVFEVDAATITDEIDVFLPGPRNLSIAPNQTSSKSGTCTVTTPYTLVALFPHMHQLGTHFKTTVHTGGADHVIHDAQYNFEHQAVIPLAPMQLAVGDTITTECTWNNTTANTVTYGESSTTEMCYSILYRYPRGTEEFCTQ